MLSSQNTKVSTDNNRIQEDANLNFNHRPQRIIIYNVLMFLWSTSNVLFYCNIVSSTLTPIFHPNTNHLLLTYYLMICSASFIILCMYYYQFKIKDLSTITIKIKDIARITLDEVLHLIVGILYFVSFLLHISITWQMCSDVCGAMNKSSGCHITIISSTLFSMILPFILCGDLIDNFLRNPHKRILFFTFFIFLSTFSYILEFQSNDFGHNTYYLASYIRFTQTSYWFITAATATICICEGFYHEGALKKHFEILLSFILLCSPIVAYSTHLIQFNGFIVSHPTWFLIVIFCIFISYDLQRLNHFHINVIGAQSNMHERLILSAAEPINKPIFMKDPPQNRLLIQAPSLPQQQQLQHADEEPFSYLVFKRFEFKLNDKKQRVILLNILLLIYSVGQFVCVFNFWVNYDQTAFVHLKEKHTKNFMMNLTQGTYEWYCTSFVFMIIISLSVIFMEWFVVSEVNETRYKLYRYSCGFLHAFCGILQCVSVACGANDYCKHLNGLFVDNNNIHYCHMQYVGAQFVSIILPLFILSIDNIGCSKLLFGHMRVRVVTLHIMIAISSLLFYVGYNNYYYSNLDTYTRVKLAGLLMIGFSFIFSSILSPLFIYLDSKTFSKISNFISSAMIIIGTAFILDVNNFDINISEWVLFIPICCLVAYEIQLLT